jgi:hypothetical protein
MYWIPHTTQQSMAAGPLLIGSCTVSPWYRYSLSPDTRRPLVAQWYSLIVCIINVLRNLFTVPNSQKMPTVYCEEKPLIFWLNRSRAHTAILIQKSCNDLLWLTNMLVSLSVILTVPRTPNFPFTVPIRSWCWILQELDHENHVSGFGISCKS